MITRDAIIKGINEHSIIFQNEDNGATNPKVVCKIGNMVFPFASGKAVNMSAKDFEKKYTTSEMADMLLKVLWSVDLAKEWGMDAIELEYCERALKEAEKGNRNYLLVKEPFAVLGYDERNKAYILYQDYSTDTAAIIEASNLTELMYKGYLKRDLPNGYASPITQIMVYENLGARDESLVWVSPKKQTTKSDYMLHGMNMVEDDSSLCAFARSITKNIIADYEIVRKDTESDTDYYDRVIDAVGDRINNELCQTNIKYDDLMERYAEEIGRLLYDMENCGYQLDCLNLSFFDNTNEVFNILLERYIAIHYGELFEEKNEK